MTWQIRRMAAGDIEAVMDLAEKIPEAPRWSFADYERVMLEDRAGFVGESDSCLLGFSVGKLIADICELESIAVAPEARMQGIGRALFAVVAEWARGAGAVRLELEVRASNLRIIKIYESAGMRREGLRSSYYDSPEEDAVLMGMVLSPVEKRD